MNNTIQAPYYYKSRALQYNLITFLGLSHLISHFIAKKVI